MIHFSFLFSITKHLNFGFLLLTTCVLPCTGGSGEEGRLRHIQGMKILLST
jgi:hypothetical protein